MPTLRGLTAESTLSSAKSWGRAWFVDPRRDRRDLAALIHPRVL
jgi:hypothetical protein